MAFQKIDIKDLDMNVFQTIGQDWMLITAGDQQKINTMTASWGGMGVFWGENVVHAYIRPQRYTKQFVDACDLATLSFLPETYKNALKICGTTSGKEVDKWKLSNLHPYYGYGQQRSLRPSWLSSGESSIPSGSTPNCSTPKTMTPAATPNRTTTKCMCTKLYRYWAKTHACRITRYFPAIPVCLSQLIPVSPRHRVHLPPARCCQHVYAFFV